MDTQEVRLTVEDFGEACKEAVAKGHHIIRGSFYNNNGCCPLTALYLKKENITLNEAVIQDFILKIPQLDTIEKNQFWAGFDGYVLGMRGPYFEMGQQVFEALQKENINVRNVHA